MVLSYVLIKGAGDLASGVALVLKEAGFPVIMTEIPQPTCVRRKVSFAEAVYEGKVEIAGTGGRLASDFFQAQEVLRCGEIPVIVDPECQIIKNHPPGILIDAAMSKINRGTSRGAGMLIALGPGFKAGVDVDAVIETQRGPHLGEPIFSGTAEPNTGIPGEVLGYTEERVLRSPTGGTFQEKLTIGDTVDAGDIVAFVDDQPVRAAIGGVIRGLLKSGLTVHPGMKIGDVHPEKKPEVCRAVTDKAWTVGLGTLRAIWQLGGKNGPGILTGKMPWPDKEGEKRES